MTLKSVSRMKKICIKVKSYEEVRITLFVKRKKIDQV